MAKKRDPQPQQAHFHIPADPQRLKAKQIQERQLERQSQRQELSSLKAESGFTVTNEMLYEMLSDVLEQQAIIESRLQKLSKQLPGLSV
ncbi:hypothetical protein [Paenibacillus sp. 2TAB19]|jgi:hypothetical protein|uniref:hypothetical protein n=1 Tax=Paenibacillus sp. 2TAB19 TaxID=3233003 RepID=UPI003F9E2F0C